MGEGEWEGVRVVNFKTFNGCKEIAYFGFLR